MKKFNVHLFIVQTTWEDIEAENEANAINKVFERDPLMYEFSKYCEDYRMEAEEVSNEEIE